MKDVAKLILGFGVLIALYIKNRMNRYKTRQDFYRLVQSEKKSWLKSVVISLLDEPVASLVADYAYLKENIQRERMSNLAIKQYSDDSLLGYASEHFDKGGDTLHEQQRGLLLPRMEELLAKSVAQTIVEIGIGNGDVIAFLAQKYTNHQFIGVDLSVQTAERKYPNIKNLSFIKGYALDLLQESKLSGDIVYFSSTLVLMLPQELKAYFKACKNAEFSQIVLNEPTWGGYLQENNSDLTSKHLEGSVWYHNYCGYLKNAGYSINFFSFFHYKHPKSPRPDIYIAVINGERQRS